MDAEQVSVYGLTACRRCGDVHLLSDYCRVVAPHQERAFWRLFLALTVLSLPVWSLAVLGFGRLTGWF